MATPSIFNRGYSGGIAARGPVPVGRGAYDLNRAAEQTFRRTGNPAMLMSMDFRNRLDERRMMPMMPPSLPPTMQAGMPASPSAPAEPKGNWVPGFGGSQIFVRDQPAAPATAPMMPAMPEPPALNPPAARAQSQGMQAMPPPMPVMPWQGISAPGAPGMDRAFGGSVPFQPLPPSTLGGATGVPPPPALDFRALPGNPNYGVPVVNGEVQKQFLPMPPAPSRNAPLSAEEMGRITAAGFEPYEVGGQFFDANGLPYLRRIAAPMETVRINDDGTQPITRKQPVGTTPAPAAMPKPAAPGMQTAKSGFTWKPVQ